MRKNNAFCSICTVNYSAYAGVLNESLRKAGHNEPHYVLIVDYEKKYKHIIEKFGFTPVFLPELEIPKVDELIEKYSAFELSNVLKPFFEEWLLKNHPEIENLVYLDTDIYVYARLDDLYDYIKKNEKFSVFLNPHLNDYKSYFETDDYKIEKKFLTYGLYNGGFYVLKNDKKALAFLEWQKKKLFDYGYQGENVYMYVDQKILDFAPILFDFVGVYKNKAYNIAHWNYFPELIEEKNSKYFVEGKKMIFFHFSQIPKGDITENFTFDISYRDKLLFQKLVSDYQECLKKNGHEEIKKIPYGYAEKYEEPPLSMVNPSLAISIELDAVKSQLNLFERELEATRGALDSTQTELYSTESQLESAATTVESLIREYNSSRSRLDLARAELARVYSSRHWKLVSILLKLVKFVFPNGSLRRKAVAGLWRLVRLPWRAVQKIKERTALQGSGSEESPEPKRRRKINFDSKKIVFVGHSYHNKTKSSKFFVDYLKQFFEVELISDESWKGGLFPNLSFIDESYLGVIFWQALPGLEILKNIKNDNLIFFPMYDGIPHDWQFWKGYKDLKIVNLSKALHKKLVDWKFDSMYIQYFPKVQEFMPGNKDEVFFWQRITKININILKKLFGNKDMKIHIHKAIDPEHQFVHPSRKDEKKFQITYSDWFKTRKEMWDLIKEKGIYVAPREFEGIGLSFLEAMAMGKAVVAANNPTMNEYIEHGKTGYLFDLSNPKEIDLTNIKEIQKSTYEFMDKGYKKWEKDKHRIIDFIKKDYCGYSPWERKPIVNVITVAYNAKDDLEKTIRSVISQDYPRINYIVIDGGSKDGTQEMIERYKEKINVYISEKDNGIYDAMNRGILHAREGYINFLNAGDEFLSKKVISELFQGLDYEYDLVYGTIVIGDVTEEKLKNPQGNKSFTKNNLLFYNSAVLCHQAMFLRKEKVPFYDTSYRIKGDLDWYFEIVEKNPDLSYCRSNVVVTNYKGGGISERRYFLDVYEVSKLIIKRFGIISFLRYRYHDLVLRRIFSESIKRMKYFLYG